MFAKSTFMERQVMKYCQYSVRFQMIYYSGTLVQTVTHQVKHMSVIGGIIRDIGHLYPGLIGKLTNKLPVTHPQLLPLILYGVEVFKLCKQKCRCYLGWKKRRANIHPTVFIHFPAE